MRPALALLAISLALLIASCQRAPEAPPAAEAPGAVNHLEEAKKALAVADWAGAAPHLRAALQQTPDSLFVHYNLAICATWLDQQDEAAREFQWVVDHAPSDSDEATTARKWLASKGRGTRTETATETESGNTKVGDSAVHGIALWAAAAGQPAAPLGRYQLFLKGLRDTPTKMYFRVLRTEENGSYEFPKLPAGSYKLSDTIGPDPKWRLKVTLEPGQDLLLDLTPDNSVQRRDDFPESK